MNLFDVLDSKINYKNTRLVIFDVDGTLYNQKELRFYMFIYILIFLIIFPYKFKEILVIWKFRKQREKFENNLESKKIIFDEECKKISKDLNIDVKEIKYIVNKWLIDKPLIFLKKCRKKGAEKIFLKLKENNIKIAIFSDYPSKLKIKKLDLFADLFVSSDDININALKPNPKGLNYIIEYFKCPIEQCIFIGDRFDKDGLCAKYAGVKKFIKV